MIRTIQALLFVCLTVQVPHARTESPDICVSVFDKAEQEQVAVPQGAEIRGVVGTGRAYFHAAPDKRCRLKDIFVIAGDRLQVYGEYGEFTSVIYWNPITGLGTAGWVDSARVPEARVTTASQFGRR
jgi:hypothetical protein